MAGGFDETWGSCDFNFQTLSLVASFRVTRLFLFTPRVESL